MCSPVRNANRAARLTAADLYVGMMFRKRNIMPTL